jgi:hypothetical protein
MIEDELYKSKETIRQILLEDLRKRKIYTKFFPSRLTGEQKQRRLTSCQNFFQTCQGSPNFLIEFFSFLRWKLPSEERGFRMLKIFIKTWRSNWTPFLLEVTVFENSWTIQTNVFRWSEVTLNGNRTIFDFIFFTLVRELYRQPAYISYLYVIQDCAALIWQGCGQQLLISNNHNVTNLTIY